MIMVEKQSFKKYKCYVCKRLYQEEHPRYPLLCMECGDFNEQKRLARHDLSGYIALVTGGRTKIGYHTALRLLRDGARVIVTSRFPYDALQRYLREPDFAEWKDRIHIYGLDFRQIDRVEKFAHFLNREFPYIDIIINNAAQTVRMPEEEYHVLALKETELRQQLVRNRTLQLPSGELPVAEFDRPEEVPEFHHLPLVRSDAGLMPYRQTEQHAWFARSDQISLMEMLEVQLINVTAPFLLNSRLKPAILRSPNRNRFIVNVSAMEGKFNTKRKGRYHVHTNMAKASLNMMTLTMAKEYKRDRIFITSVDPGWVSNQIPGKEIKPPLGFEDAAARICDPIYEGKDAEQPVTGVFLKDFRKVDW
jgi:NAD(P)-dependent dehydrogenase (short-subunit alcohol dehydrogenase family)